MAGIYGSAPGCLCTFPNSPACPGMEGKHEKLGQIATTVARPDRGYAGTYNYFDPDNFFSMTALIYSGEPFLQEQARTVIERSGAWLCIGEVEKKNTCTYGQLPHHFVGDKPTVLALSGATQTAQTPSGRSPRCSTRGTPATSRGSRRTCRRSAPPRPSAST